MQDRTRVKAIILGSDVGGTERPKNLFQLVQPYPSRVTTGRYQSGVGQSLLRKYYLRLIYLYNINLSVKHSSKKTATLIIIKGISCLLTSPSRQATCTKSIGLLGGRLSIETMLLFISDSCCLTSIR